MPDFFDPSWIPRAMAWCALVILIVTVLYHSTESICWFFIYLFRRDKDKWR